MGLKKYTAGGRKVVVHVVAVFRLHQSFEVLIGVLDVTITVCDQYGAGQAFKVEQNCCSLTDIDKRSRPLDVGGSCERNVP